MTKNEVREVVVFAFTISMPLMSRMTKFCPVAVKFAQIMDLIRTGKV